MRTSSFHSLNTNYVVGNCTKEKIKRWGRCDLFCSKCLFCSIIEVTSLWIGRTNKKGLINRDDGTHSLTAKWARIKNGLGIRTDYICNVHSMCKTKNNIFVQCPTLRMYLFRYIIFFPYNKLASVSSVVSVTSKHF